MPPLPGTPVRRAVGAERSEALFFDGMERRLPAGLSRDDEPLYLNLDFLDGTRGAHVNISGISGVATKTSYATFLLYSLFESGVLGPEAVNTKALVFNVKGEDLLWLDRPNIRLDDRQAARYGRVGLPVSAFPSVAFFAPPRRGAPTPVPDVASRDTGVTSFFWTLDAFCRDELLPFLFADAEDDRQQYTMVVHNVTARLRDAGGRARGEIPTNGSKNSALPALAAGLLTDEAVTSHRVPRVRDIRTMERLLVDIGTTVDVEGETVRLRTERILSPEAPYELVKTMRASSLVLGPLVARSGRARVSLPGGCAIGARPINLHIFGLEQLGATINQAHGYIEAVAPDGLRGADRLLRPHHRNRHRRPHDGGRAGQGRNRAPQCRPRTRSGGSGGPAH